MYRCHYLRTSVIDMTIFVFHKYCSRLSVLKQTLFFFENKGMTLDIYTIKIPIRCALYSFDNSELRKTSFLFVDYIEVLFKIGGNF